MFLSRKNDKVDCFVVLYLGFSLLFCLLFTHQINFQIFLLFIIVVALFFIILRLYVIAWIIYHTTSSQLYISINFIKFVKENVLYSKLLSLIVNVSNPLLQNTLLYIYIYINFRITIYTHTRRIARKKMQSIETGKITASDLFFVPIWTIYNSIVTFFWNRMKE